MTCNVEHRLSAIERELRRLIDLVEGGTLPTMRTVTLDEFWPVMRQKLGGKEKHRRWQRDAYKNYLSPAFGTWPLDQIRPSSVEDWMDGLFREKGLKYASVLKLLKFLKRVLKVATSREFATRYEAVSKVEIPGKYKPAKQDQEGHPLPPVCVTALWDSPEEGQSKWVPLWALTSGQRLGALKKGRWEYFSGTDTDQWWFLFTDQKNGRDQQRPLQESAVRAIRGYVDECHDGEMPKTGLIFPNPGTGKSWGESYDFRWGEKVDDTGKVIRPCTLKRLGALPEGEHYTFHNLRDTFISDLIDQGLSLEDVQYLARHSNPRVTLGYVNRDGERVAQRLRLLTGPSAGVTALSTAPALGPPLPVRRSPS